MKAIIAFFVAIWNWIAGLFVSKKEVKPDIIEKRIEQKQQRVVRKQHVPPHNNRKNTRGRRTQHIGYDRTSRPIYHTIAREGSNI